VCHCAQGYCDFQSSDRLTLKRATRQNLNALVIINEEWSARPSLIITAACRLNRVAHVKCRHGVTLLCPCVCVQTALETISVNSGRSENVWWCATPPPNAPGKHTCFCLCFYWLRGKLIHNAIWHWVRTVTVLLESDPLFFKLYFIKTKYICTCRLYQYLHS